MPMIPISMAPGICKVDSPYAANRMNAYVTSGNTYRQGQGRFTAGDKVRFVAGFPEKIGGWTDAGVAGIIGRPSTLTAWQDRGLTVRLAIATNSHVYTFDGTTLTDITPQRPIQENVLTDAITTTEGSPNFAVADTNQVVQNGDYAFISASDAVGGLTIAGIYQILDAAPTGYTAAPLNDVSPATSTATGGGTINVTYYRKALSNPFTTTVNSATVTVNDPGHGAKTNDFVDFGNAAAVGGILIAGEYRLTVLDEDNYTIAAASPATSSATGGGTPWVFYDVSVQQQTFSTSPGGYGSGGYGTGGYGGGVFGYLEQLGGAWSLSPYGQQLILNPIGGGVYVYDPSIGGRAYVIPNAPESCLAVFVDRQRFVIALGIGGEALQLGWPDQNDYTDWTSLPTNTAESGRTVQGGSYFVGGLAVRDDIDLIWTNRTCFTLTYSGDNNVYDTGNAGDNCGLVGLNAAVAEGGVAYWMSDADFWTWNGTAEPLPSDDIRDYVYTSINKTQLAKCTAGMVRAKKEVWFFYPSAASDEIDSYVIYHTDQGCWSTGTLERTAWVDKELFNYPFATDAEGNVFAHEVTTDADGAALEASLTFSPTDITGSNKDVDIFGFVPDFERLLQDLTLTVLVQAYPQDAPTSYGPFTITDNDSAPRIDLRADGKMFGFELVSNTIGGDFRLGQPLVDAQPSGARR